MAIVIKINLQDPKRLLRLGINSLRLSKYLKFLNIRSTDILIRVL